LAARISPRDLITGARFLARLRSFVRHAPSPQQARALLCRRFEQREASFLGIARRAVYEQPDSPYRQLLELAGCEYGDLERLVRQDGVEGALRVLFAHGVYVAVDEFKGRRPAKRGSATIAVNPQLLRNPLASFHVPARSGGSRSKGTPLLFDLEFVRGCGVNASLALDARGGGDWLKATWETSGAGARFRLLKLSSFGAPPVRWFSQVDPAAPDLDPVFRYSELAMRIGGGLGAVRLPPAVHAPLHDPLVIVRWMAGVLQSGATPFMQTFASSAVRLCQRACEAGISLEGAQLTLMGEPTTEARLNAIRRSGARALPRYGSIECGPIGYGCLNPERADDVHLLHDLHAVIQPSDVGGTIGGFPMNAVFVSALHPASPFVMLNVSMGDQATMVGRSCGCAMERLGWGTHLHSIRSYEKLTGGGMTFLDTDVISVLEEVLPGRFGGAPTDYQLLETEAADGQPVLTLLVHPRVGPLDADAVADTFLRAIGSTSSIERVMESLWRDAAFLRVARGAPLATHSGKVLHFHVDHRAGTGGGPTSRFPPSAG
jgi:hypothetical protein